VSFSTEEQSDEVISKDNLSDVGLVKTSETTQESDIKQLRKR
jgi:hypothetical protein